MAVRMDPKMVPPTAAPMTAPEENVVIVYVEHWPCFWRRAEDLRKKGYRWKIFDFYMWWRIGNVIGSMLNLWNRYESVKYCILIFIKVYSGDLFSTCYFFQNLSVCNCEFFLIILTMWEVKKFKKYSVIIIF